MKSETSTVPISKKRLWTGRIMSPLLSNTLFPIYFAILMWGGIYLRDNLISEFIPFRKRGE